MAEGIGEYRFKLLMGFIFVTLLIGFSIETIYREFFESIVKLATTEEYSYILVSVFSVFTVLYLSTRYTGFAYGVRPSRLILALSLGVASILLVYLSTLDLDHKVQILGVSFALFFIALLLLIYEPTTPSETIPLLTPLLLIPLPAGYVDRLTPILSRYVGRLVALLTGIKLIETPGFTQLEVVTKTGEVVRLSVEAACTGIITASSIVSVVPVILYVVSFSSDKPLRKFIVSIASLLAALFIGLLGNILRVLLVVYAAINIGAEQAYELFHYSPSLVYSVISILVAFLLVNKYSRFPRVFSRVLRTSGVVEASWEYIGGLILVAMIFTGLVFSLTTLGYQGGRVQGIVVEVNSGVEDFIVNPEKYLSTEGFTLTGKWYSAFLTRVLGALSVYRIMVQTPRGFFDGYLEIVDTPARLHTWQLCLTLQGYNITRSWFENIDGYRVTYIYMEKSEWRGVLAYTLVPVTVLVGNDSMTMYVRLSLEARGDINEASSLLKDAFSEFMNKYIVKGVQDHVNISPYIEVLNSLVTLFILYIATLVLWRFLARVRV